LVREAILTPRPRLTEQMNDPTRVLALADQA
jgi:hypothetical protein